MKTAISLPDELYKEAQEVAEAMGIPRSQLFARALEEFIRYHERRGITDRLNSVYAAESAGTSSLEDVGLEELRKLTRYDSW